LLQQQLTPNWKSDRFYVQSKDVVKGVRRVAKLKERKKDRYEE
jgi:hypothetical protein